MHIADRPVGGVDHSQRRGVRLDEQQCGVGAIGCAADRLSQRGRGHKRRDQHHVFDLVGRQRITENVGFDGVRPGHTARLQLVAALCRAFPGAEDGRNHLICRSGRGQLRGDVEVILIDGDPAGAFTFYQHHADCLWRHAHTKYDVHRSSELFRPV